MAKELSKQRKVFYLDHPFSIKDFFTDILPGKFKRRIGALLFGTNIYTSPEPSNNNLFAVTPQLILPINWLRPGPLYNFFCSVNNRIFLRAVKKIIRQHNLKDYILWNSYNPFYCYEFPADIRPALFIYQSRDNIRESDYVSRHGPRLEEIASANADLRLATSSELARSLSRQGRPFYLLPNGADTSIFVMAANRQAFQPPPELTDLARPVIGYMGNMGLREDYELLHRLVAEFADCTFLLVGPVDKKRRQIPEALGKFANVIFTGPKALRDLPRYLAFMDVTIIPFLANDLTRSIYPLKLNEYLAAGKPVVTTNFSEDLRDFESIAYVSGSHDAFIADVRRALAERGDELKNARMKVAVRNSWPERVLLFWQLVEKHPQNR